MNWDYIAGFFDGEGHVLVRKYNHSTKGPFLKMVVGLTQAEERKSVLEEIHRFLLSEGFFNPHLTVSMRQSQNRQKVWRIQLQNLDDALHFLVCVENRVVAKRSQVLEAIKLLKEHPRKVWHFSQEQLQEIRVLYGQGHSTVTIGAKFGVGCFVINNQLRKMGISLRSRNAWTDKGREKLSNYWKVRREKVANRVH